MLQDIPECNSFCNVSITHLLHLQGLFLHEQIQICNSFNPEELLRYCITGKCVRYLGENDFSTSKHRFYSGHFCIYRIVIKKEKKQVYSYKVSISLVLSEFKHTSSGEHT